MILDRARAAPRTPRGSHPRVPPARARAEPASGARAELPAVHAVPDGDHLRRRHPLDLHRHRRGVVADRHDAVRERRGKAVQEHPPPARRLVAAVLGVHHARPRAAARAGEARRERAVQVRRRVVGVDEPRPLAADHRREPRDQLDVEAGTAAHHAQGDPQPRELGRERTGLVQRHHHGRPARAVELPEEAEDDPLQAAHVEADHDVEDREGGRAGGAHEVGRRGGPEPEVARRGLDARSAPGIAADGDPRALRAGRSVSDEADSRAWGSSTRKS